MGEKKLSLSGYYKPFKKFLCLYTVLYILANILLYFCKLRFRAWFSYFSLAIISLGICICITVNIFKIRKKVVRYILVTGFWVMYLFLSVKSLLFLNLVFGFERTAMIDGTKYSVVEIDFLDTDKLYFEYKNFLVSSSRLRIKEFYTTGDEPMYTEIYDEDGNLVEEIYAEGG